MYIDSPEFLKRQYSPWLARNYGVPQPAIDGIPIFLLTFLTCNIIFFLSRALSPKYFPGSYGKLTRFQKLNWNVHVVSEVNCIVMSILAFSILIDGQLGHDPYTKVLGKTDFATATYALSMGYFLYDFLLCARYVFVFGPGFMVHGGLCFIAYSLTTRPFLNYYGAVFMLWELSTVFLNIHWFLDKAGMTGTRAQWVNGICLLATFLGARILFGWYMSWATFRDIFHVINNGSKAQRDSIPTWLWGFFVSANVVLNTLNAFWFRQMIKSLQKRFKPAEGDAGAKKQKSKMK